jgi:predicted acetyltransferase
MQNYNKIGGFMDSCVLIKPSFSYESDIYAFRKEMLDANSSMDGMGPLRRMENIKEWLEFNQRCENIETVPENWVTCEQFIYVREADNKIVGMIQFRHYFNENLKKYGGHIGYSVRPDERGKGYAKKMLSNCLKICKTYGLEKVLVTCIQGNESSKRTILANGGIFESTIYCEPDNVYIERYWIEI